MRQKIGIIGSGNVGSALKRGLEKAGYEVRNSQKGTARETAEWGEVVILAVPFTALDDVVRELSDSINGKIVVDVTNALTQDMQLALGFSTSGAEELQKKVSGAQVVKAFNTVFAQHMDKGSVQGQPSLRQAMTSRRVAKRWSSEGRSVSMRWMQDRCAMRGSSKHWVTSIYSWDTCWGTAPTSVSNSFIEFSPAFLSANPGRICIRSGELESG